MIARIRPLLPTEISKDIIVHADRAPTADPENKTIVRIPNPKKAAEAFSFHFNSVYDSTATQAEVYDGEVAPTVRHLFKGCDVTLFAYGVTGTGKTHTMRGGKALADRGVIPRLLSSIYRRARKIEKDSAGATEVAVEMSYYEIYNDRVYDLFEPPEKRTPAGLPIRDVGNGKTQVVGLTSRPCASLKEFEVLYTEANVNRSTSATKLNAHSSRSHAVLCVTLTQTTGSETRVSTASAIDLAGSEDNRRTDNNKERLVESASINKSLFVLAQCVEAISKGASRIPYRESKMTRILSLGQNDGFTVMILNLAPVRSYHLDTLSSLNFANRTKKIEVNEVENQPFYRAGEVLAKPKVFGGDGKMGGSDMQPLHRQPLKPKVPSQHAHLRDATAGPIAKPAKQFAVVTDKPPRPSGVPVRSPKRTSSEAIPTLGRPSKMFKPALGSAVARVPAGLSADAIEALIERKVAEALAERTDSTTVSNTDAAISEEVAKRLEALERRVQSRSVAHNGESERAEGLQYLLMAKQHQVRGEDQSALKMYELALPHFPGNDKLARKITGLRDRIAEKRTSAKGGVPLPRAHTPTAVPTVVESTERPLPRRKDENEDESYHAPSSPPLLHHDSSDDDDGAPKPHPRTKIRARPAASRALTAPHPFSPSHPSSADEGAFGLTPRTREVLNIINTKDVNKIKGLQGVGAKKAVAIVERLNELERTVESLRELAGLKGVGVKGVEKMRLGVGSEVDFGGVMGEEE